MTGPRVGSRGQSIQVQGASAHRAAIKRLREAHPEEFANLLREERVKRGLPEERTAATVQGLRDRIRELEQELLNKVGPA